MTSSLIHLVADRHNSRLARSPAGVVVRWSLPPMMLRYDAIGQTPVNSNDGPASQSAAVLPSGHNQQSPNVPAPMQMGDNVVVHCRAWLTGTPPERRRSDSAQRR